MQSRSRETIDKQWSVCTRPFTQCARLQYMYTPTVGAHLRSLCMRALPHFGLGILAIPCDTVRGYVCETSRNRAKPRETTAKPFAKPARNLAKPRETSAKPRDIIRETGAKPRDISAKPARNRAKPPRNHRETIRFARGRPATLDISHRALERFFVASEKL